MLDIKHIRQHPKEVADAMNERNVTVDIGAILAADERYRASLTALENARAEQNAASSGPVSDERIGQLKEQKARIKTLQDECDDLAAQLDTLLAPLPNIPSPDTPRGASAEQNVQVSVFGQQPSFKFTPRHYMDIAEPLGLIDTERAAVVSGTRFGYLKGAAALMEFALIQYALSRMTDSAFIGGLIAQHGIDSPATPFVPVIPPVLIRPQMMRAMGFTERAGIERGGDEIYYLPADDLYLVGTSEQSIGPMFYDTITPAERLPIRYVGFSTCFRRESGAAGKDTRGILRVHQFDKLEMFSVTSPERSEQEHRLLLAVEEALMQGLGLHYRVMRLCTGDIGQASAATYDIETWMPGQETYRETHSCSNTTDYQSRALKARMRDSDGEIRPLHMLNGTVFSNRPIIAILEQFQQEDGSVRVPEVLRPYLGGLDTIRA